jgi:hypothetical protein
MRAPPGGQEMTASASSANDDAVSPLDEPRPPHHGTPWKRDLRACAGNRRVRFVAVVAKSTPEVPVAEHALGYC